MAQPLVGRQDVRVVGFDHLAKIEHQRPVGDGERAAGVLLDQYDGEADLVAQALEQSHELADDEGGQAEGWFVEQQ